MPQESRILVSHSAAPSRIPCSASAPFSLSLHVLPPFRLDLTVWALRRRPENILDRWDGRTYRRALRLETQSGAHIIQIEAQQSGSPERPRLRVTANAPNAAENGSPLRRLIRSALERMLGLTIDLGNFYSFAAKHKQFRALIAGFSGFKPPRYPTIFEALLNAISCQQVSLNVGIMLLNRLVENFGCSPTANPSLHACPSPADLASLSTGTLRSLGYSQNKERAILELSRAVAGGEINLESLCELTDSAALEKLVAIRGIGRWSAEYALLRGMGRLNVFPGDDVGGWNNLQKHLRLRSRPDYAKTRKLLAPWENYAGLLYFHFLLANLRSRAAIP